MWDGLGLVKKKKQEIVIEFLELPDRTSASDDKVKSDEIKLFRNAQRSVNVVANYITGDQPTRTFCCQYSNKVIRFEVLTLVDSKKYVRHCHAKVKIPENGFELQGMLKEAASGDI